METIVNRLGNSAKRIDAIIAEEKRLAESGDAYLDAEDLDALRAAADAAMALAAMIASRKAPDA